MPDAEHAWVKLELSNISKEGRNRFVRARVQNETRLLILDFVVIDLRDAWPTIELAAKTRLLNAVVHVDSAGQPRKEAPAAGGYPIVKLGPGGDFTRDISPEDLRLRRQAAGGAA